MTRFHFESIAGVDYGTREAMSVAEALLSLHRDAGYGPRDVWIEPTVRRTLCFRNDEIRNLIGDTTDWIVTVEDPN